MKKPNIKKIVVFGLGAAGSNFLVNMAYAHPTLSFTGVDFDVVEARNYEAGTQPYTKADLNRPKVQAMQKILFSSRKTMDGEMIRITSTKQISDIVGNPSEALVIDAFDNVESRNLFLSLNKTHNVLHIGFSAILTGEAVWAESYSEMTPNGKGDFDVCQAHIARPFINGLTAIAALTATDFIDTGIKKSVYFDSKLKIIVF
jgi:hypothetical protein